MKSSNTKIKEMLFRVPSWDGTIKCSEKFRINELIKWKKELSINQPMNVCVCVCLQYPIKMSFVPFPNWNEDQLGQSPSFTFKAADMFYTIFCAVHIGTILWLNIGCIVAFKPFTTLEWGIRIGGIANITTDRCGWILYQLSVANTQTNGKSKINSNEK